MVRGSIGSRQCGDRGRGVPPPIVSMPEGSNPHGDEHTIE